MLLHWSGPVFALVGVIVGTWGTLLMCRVYHPFSTWKVILHILRVMGMLFCGDVKGASKALKDASDFAAVNQENKFRVLAGVYVLVFSFFLQSVGAILILVDLAKHPGR